MCLAHSMRHPCQAMDQAAGQAAQEGITAKLFDEVLTLLLLHTDPQELFTTLSRA